MAFEPISMAPNVSLFMAFGFWADRCGLKRSSCGTPDLPRRSPRPTCKDSAFAPKPGLRKGVFLHRRQPRSAHCRPPRRRRRSAAHGMPPAGRRARLLRPRRTPRSYPLPSSSLSPAVHRHPSPPEKESGRRIGPPFSRWRPDGRIRCRKGARPTRCVSQMIPRICRFLSTFAEIRDVCTVSEQHVRLRMIV